MKNIYVFFVFLLISLAKSQNNSSVVIHDELGNTSATIDCSYPLVNGCFNLSSTYPTMYSTEKYVVTSENYSPYLPLDGGTPLKANYDDIYATKIDIPFNFCFFENSFNQIVIGSNGVITFDVKQLGTICYPNIPANNPNPQLTRNAIFGVMNDMMFSNSDDSEIYYNVVGTAPYRKMVITFYKGRIPGCTDTATSQIVLSESTYDIEIFVENKPAPCSTIKFGNALIGIQNSDGSIGYTPPGRNTGTWSATNEAWKFSPSGTPLVPKLSWTDSANNVIGNTQNITVCPQKSEVYTLSVDYPVCGSGSLILTGQFNATFSIDYPIATDYTKIFCSVGGTPQNVNLDDYKAYLTTQPPANFDFSYYLSYADAQSGTNPQSPNVVVSNNTTYYVKIANPLVPSCYKIVALNFKFENLSVKTQNVSICDVNNDHVELAYLMSRIDVQLIPPGFSGTVSYFTNQNDALNNTNAVTNLDIYPSTVFWVRLDNGQCNAVFGPISVNFISAPVINSPVYYTYTACDINTDDTEEFHWNQIIAPLITTDPNLLVTFYGSYADAYSGLVLPITTVKEGHYSVYVRVEDPSGCFSIAEVIMDVTFSKVHAQDQEINLCYNGPSTINIDLSQYASSMYTDTVIPFSAISIGYYDNPLDAQNQVNPISPNQTVILTSSFTTKIFYIRFTDATGCYSYRKLIINMIHPVAEVSLFNVCDKLNDNSEKINLSDYDSQIIGNQSATTTYYASNSDAINNVNPITSFVLHNNTTTLYVKVTSKNCNGIYPITFNLSPSPVVKSNIDEVLNNVCDNNGDGTENYNLTQHESSIYPGNDVNFMYYTNYDATTGGYSGFIPDPKNFPVPGSATVYAVVQYKSTGCYSISTIQIKLNFLPIIKLHNAVLKKCDHEFNLNETFIISDAIPQIFIQSENGSLISDFNISYYKTQADANAGLPSTQIGTSYVALISDITVWVRFQSKITSCYSTASINLLTYIPPKARASSFSINDICDGNLDGLYETDLMAHTNEYAAVPNPDYVYSFYLTYNDLLNGNAIANPSNFTMNPFPKQVWVKIENIPGCDDSAVINLNLGTKVNLLSPNILPLEVCDNNNDDTEVVDLTQFQPSIYGSGTVFEYYPSLMDLNNGTNLISNPANYNYVQGINSGKIVVKVSVAGFCPNYTEIDLHLKKPPVFTLSDYYFCPYNDSFVDIVPDFSQLDIAHYEWIDPNGNTIATDQPYIMNVSVAGVYTINVTGNNSCNYSTTFNVLKYEVPIIAELIPGNNQYTVIATGSKTILYSIDGVNWQTSNIFSNLTSGVYTFYVKFDGENCLGLSRQGVILDLPNVFTPNGDGVNDTWEINDLYVFGGDVSKLEIYDRYGKKVFSQESASKLVWDGDWGHAKASTATYWYKLDVPDGRTITGWLFLKSRD